MKSYEERTAIINDILFGQAPMLMTKPIKAGTLKNKTIGDACTGFTFQIDNLSYRGIWVSTLEGIKVTVDGQEMPQSSLMLCLNGVKYPIYDLESHTEIFWGARDICEISVNMIGGLSKGEHKIGIEILKRADFGHSYGEGEDGYADAHEFHTPQKMADEAVFVIA